MWCFLSNIEWCKECVSIYPNPTKLQKEIDVFMKGFDKNKEEVNFLLISNMEMEKNNFFFFHTGEREAKQVAIGTR